MTLGLGEIVPGSIPCELAGKSWNLAPWTIGDDAETVRNIASKWQRPLDVALAFIRRTADMTEPEKRSILEIAYRDEMKGPQLTDAERQQFLDSREGTAWLFYMRAVKNHPELTLPYVETLLAAEYEMRRANERASRLSGERPLKNSTAPAQPGANSDEPPSAESSASSSASVE